LRRVVDTLCAPYFINEMSVIFLIYDNICAFNLESKVVLVAIGNVAELPEMFIDKLVQLLAQIDKLLISDFS
jgi:hypothetical protein